MLTNARIELLESTNQKRVCHTAFRVSRTYCVVLFFPFLLPSDHIMAFFFSLSLIAEVNSGTLKEQPPVSHASLASTKETKMQLFATIVLLVTPRVEIQMSSASHAFLGSIKM